MDHLTFCLYAPIAAMGSMVSGRTRVGWDRPARSALLGLIAGCLGVDRSDEESHQCLERELDIAVLVERSGTKFMDFQTVRTPSGKGNWTTRAEELAAINPKKDNPITTSREYRIDAVFLVAVSLRNGVDPRFSLEDIKAALETPFYAPYMGRKACPLGLPMSPVIEAADDPIKALSHRQKTGREREFLQSLHHGRTSKPYIALEERQCNGYAIARYETRSDRLLNRERWQYLPREEVIVDLF